MDPSESLRQLRDFLRLPETSLQDFHHQLSQSLSALGLHPTSDLSTSSLSKQLEAVRRYLPSIQTHLIEDALPHFINAMDDKTEELVLSFFVPTKITDCLDVRRSIALVSYLNLPPYLNTPKEGQTTLPKPMRPFMISLLARLSLSYGLDDIYYTELSVKNTVTKENADGIKRLQWENGVNSIAAIPSKLGNATGRWKLEEADDMPVPSTLSPKPYFDRLVVTLESLMYELSQSPSPELSPLHFVIQKLSAIGLINGQMPDSMSRTPSFISSLLPSLLAHLHPLSTSPLLPYPSNFLPSIFLPLSTSTLSTFVDHLLTHLSYNLIEPTSPLNPESSDQRIKRAVEVFKLIVGQPKVGGEAWDAVIRSATVGKGKNKMDLGDTREQARDRLIVGWVAEGGAPAAQSFIDTIVDAWTDPKKIKFAMFSEQFRLTHILLLSLSLFPPYSRWLVDLSRRSRFILTFQSYLSHPDPSIRRLGMVVAEIMSEITILDDGDSAKRTDEDEIEELRRGLEIDDDGDTTIKPKKSSSNGGGSARLKFRGMWDGDGEGKEECRWLRRGMGVRDGDAVFDDNEDGWLLGWKVMTPAAQQEHIRESVRGRPASSNPPSKHPQTKKQKMPRIVMLDPEQMDDPLEGYESSSPSSSRAPSPTPEYLNEVAADPTLGLDEANKKKVKRPLYIPQLTELLKEREKPECVEMGLQWGEGLVRAKREFGTELAENAVAVTLMVMGLNDSFQIEEFEEKAQGLLNALVACAPKQTAPFLCEQYFNAQFSLQKKTAILTALAMGARELAGLAIPQPLRTTRAIDFPSKTLPPAIHAKYISAADTPANRLIAQEGQLDQAIDGVRNLILSKGARKGQETVPQLAREKRLRVGETKRPLVAPINSLAASQMSQLSRPVPVVPFKDIAAEFFIMPLINRFWQHFQDSSVREERAVMMGTRYRAAGAGMVLSPMAMEKFFMSLALMLDAARHSPVFLSVICPEALELAATIGIRHPTRPTPTNNDDDALGTTNADAQVLSAALELTLVCLDLSIELDNGRTLAMDKAQLVMAVGEWASGVFQVESEGREVSAGQGGRREGKIRAEAAGVVIKVGEIGEKWGHLGVGKY